MLGYIFGTWYLYNFYEGTYYSDSCKLVSNNYRRFLSFKLKMSKLKSTYFLFYFIFSFIVTCIILKFLACNLTNVIIHRYGCTNVRLEGRSKNPTHTPNKFYGFASILIGLDSFSFIQCSINQINFIHYKEASQIIAFSVSIKN